MNENPNTIQKIVIVGGGSSGWMAAAYLDKMFNTKEEINCRITLIEADDVPSIGVGEATIPIFSGLFHHLGIPEEVWMKRCNATYKMAIKFANWVDKAENDAYWHTFGNLPMNSGGSISMMQQWVKWQREGNDVPFAKAVHEAVHLCEAKKAPKPAYEKAQRQIPYAFHLDAGLLADYLKEICKENGVEHLVGRVEDIMLDDKGFISRLKTDKHGDLQGDLYIDCTGFASVLMGKTLKEPFESYEDCLFVDRAVAMQLKYEDGDIYNENQGGLNPYTTATALDAGWIWHTPLINRDGNGYVYSSRFISDDAAEAEMRRHLGPRAEMAMARRIKMRIGKMRRSWVKNCVAIGLSGGFIEPLESTGLALIQIGISTLVHFFPDKNFDPVLLAGYNKVMDEQYENIRDFIVLHYCLTQREDTPFWKAVKYETKVPDSLQAKLDEWKRVWPNDLRGTGGRMFGPYNYISILAGMRYLPESYLPVLNYSNGKQAEQFFKRVETLGNNLVNSFPTEAEYFKALERIKAFQEDTDW